MNPLRTVLRLVGVGLLSLGLASPLQAAGVDKQISAALDANQPIEALILLDDSQQTRALGAKSEQALNALDSTDYARYLSSKANALNSLKETVLQQVSSELQVLTNYSALPVLHVRLNNANALKGLLASGKVLSVDPNRANQAFLTQSLPLIKQPQAQAAGYAGNGATVCVLDTGVNYTLSAFGSCSAPGGNCKVAYSADIAPSDGLLDDSSTHGTNVAATVLGVAPSARVAMLDVFRSDGYAYDSDLINALNWCISNKSTYNLAQYEFRGRALLQPTTDY